MHVNATKCIVFQAFENSFATIDIRVDNNFIKENITKRFQFKIKLSICHQIPCVGRS